MNKGKSFDRFNSESVMNQMNENDETNEVLEDRLPSKLNLVKSARENLASRIGRFILIY